MYAAGCTLRGRVLARCAHLATRQLSGSQLVGCVVTRRVGHDLVESTDARAWDRVSAGKRCVAVPGLLNHVMGRDARA